MVRTKVRIVCCMTLAVPDLLMLLAQFKLADCSRLVAVAGAG